MLALAEKAAGNDRSKKALENIAEVLEILDIYGVSEFLTIDLGEIRGLDYHSGLTFEGFVGGWERRCVAVDVTTPLLPNMADLPLQPVLPSIFSPC